MENYFFQVFISSGSSSDLNVPSSSTIEAPLTISLPRSYRDGVQFENVDPACSIKGASITVPVSVQRQPVLTPPSVEGLNANGSTYGNNASRRKRKPWSEAEDLELMAAVKKCGEGNWANIIRGDFLSDRTASQLSQVFFCFSPLFMFGWESMLYIAFSCLSLFLITEKAIIISFFLINS